MSAERALAARLSGDAALTALVGSAARILWGWPGELLEKPQPQHFPRITFFAPTENVVRSPLVPARVQVDTWAWDVALRDQIRSRIRELLEEASWRYEGQRYYAIEVDARTWPSGPPRRAMMIYRVSLG